MKPLYNAAMVGRWVALRSNMERLFFSVCIATLFLAAAVAVHGEEKVLLYQTDTDRGGGTNQWWLPLSRLERLPLWHGEGDAPVSIKRALKIARKWITTKSGDGDIDHILLRPINPDSPEPKYRLSFFYTIEFCV